MNRSGAPNDPVTPTGIVDGTQTATALDAAGKTTRATTRAVANSVLGAVVSRETYTYFDPLELSYQVVDLANRTNVSKWKDVLSILRRFVRDASQPVAPAVAALERIWVAMCR